MHLKVFVKLKKTLKTLSSGQKKPPKKTPKTQKTQKNQKKPKNHWAGFFFLKPGFFPTLRQFHGKIRKGPDPFQTVLDLEQRNEMI